MAESARIVEDDELDWLIKVTRKTSGQNGPRNVAMLLTLFGTGMKSGEIGGLKVSDILAPDGEFRRGQKVPKGRRREWYEAEVRAEIAFNGYPRPLPWNNKRLTAALDDYFSDRLARNLGTWDSTAYRGLDPDSPAFLSRGSKGFACRISIEDGRERRQYASLSNLFGRLFAKAGVMGAVAGSARRTFAVKLKRRAVDVTTIAEILGNNSLATVRRLCAGDTRRLGDVLRDII